MVKKGYEEVEDTIREAINLIGGVKNYVKKGEKVLIKPNFCVAKPASSGVTTNPKIVEELIKILLEIDANPIVGEGSAYPLNTRKIFKKLGIYELGTKYGVDIVDLNEDEIAEVLVPNYLVLKKIRIAKTALTCNKILSVAKLKTHELVGATLSLKNMKGVLPGIEKHVSHRKGLEKAIADLCSVVKPTLAIIDGIIGSAGASSFTGKPVKSSLILTGNDPVAVDAVSSYIMGFNPGEMDVVRHASMKGVGVADISNISVTGEDLEGLRLKIAPLFTKTKLKDRFIRYVEVKINDVFHRSAYPVAQFFRKIPETSFVTFYAAKTKILLNKNACNKCNVCVLACPNEAIDSENGYPQIRVEMCEDCPYCVEACPSNALTLLT